MPIIKYLIVACTVTLVISIHTAAAQDIYVYAANGQSESQLSQDRYACHKWAVKESNFDPSQVSGVEPLRTVTVPVPRNPSESATEKGTIAGAVAGGVIGAQSNRTSEGAVVGAVIGTIMGASIEEKGQQAARNEALKQAKANSQTNAQIALKNSNYRRAISACLEGKGYTVR